MAYKIILDVASLPCATADIGTTVQHAFSELVQRMAAQLHDQANWRTQ